MIRAASIARLPAPSTATAAAAAVDGSNVDAAGPSRRFLLPELQTPPSAAAPSQTLAAVKYEDFSPVLLQQFVLLNRGSSDHRQSQVLGHRRRIFLFL